MNLVSILIPVYGVERYIRTCAESLFEQTYPEIEYIFVDDCTPDRSIGVLREVMSRYPARAARVSLLRHQHNSGVGTARATAMAAATGQWLMHVDSDDSLPPTAVETLVRRMEETGADIVDGAYREWADGRVLPPCLPYHGPTRSLLRMMLCHNVVQHQLWARLYRRSLFAEHGIDFEPGIDYCEDYAVVTRALLHARRAWTDEVVYLYRTDNSSSYTHQVSIRNLTSNLRSNQVVTSYLLAHDPARRYRRALDIGIADVYRSARRNGLTRGQLTPHFSHRPHGLLMRLLARAFGSACPYRLANTVYLALRRLYVMGLSPQI